MVQALRHVEQAMGNGEKQPTLSEIDTKTVARKQLVAAKSIKAGDVFSPHNLTAKRAAKGLSPMYYWDLLGRSATKDYQSDESIDQ